jgi:hypothetical protein
VSKTTATISLRGSTANTIYSAGLGPLRRPLVISNLAKDPLYTVASVPDRPSLIHCRFVGLSWILQGSMFPGPQSLCSTSGSSLHPCGEVLSGPASTVYHMRACRWGYVASR